MSTNESQVNQSIRQASAEAATGEGGEVSTTTNASAGNKSVEGICGTVQAKRMTPELRRWNDEVRSVRWESL